MAGTGETEKVVQLGCQDRKGNRESQGHKESLFVEKESEELLDPRGQSEYLVHRGQWEKKDCKGPLACLGLKANKELMIRGFKAHQQEEQSTLAGGGPPVPVVRELNWSTREELEGAGTKTQVEGLTFCVFLKTRFTYSLAMVSKDLHTYMELNTGRTLSNRWEMFEATMFHVLSALHLPVVLF